MTKQEEIREGVLHIVAEPVDITLGEMTDKILKYLHSQGVVIKVDRELPSIWNTKGEVKTALRYRGDILQAGCVAVETLIE